MFKLELAYWAFKSEPQYLSSCVSHRWLALCSTVCMYIHMFICISIYLHIHTHIHIYVHVHHGTCIRWCIRQIDQPRILVLFWGKRPAKIDCLVPAKTPKTENSNLHWFELHRSLSKGTKLLFQVIKAIINQFRTRPTQIMYHVGHVPRWKLHHAVRNDQILKVATLKP